MNILLNGEEEEIDGSIDVQSFLNEELEDLNGIVVVYNDKVLKREVWAGTFLKDGDDLEVLQFVSGG